MFHERIWKQKEKEGEGREKVANGSENLEGRESKLSTFPFFKYQMG